MSYNTNPKANYTELISFYERVTKTNHTSQKQQIFLTVIFHLNPTDETKDYINFSFTLTNEIKFHKVMDYK